MNLFVLFNAIVLIVFFFTIISLVMVLLKDSPKAKYYAPVCFGTAIACFLILILAAISVSIKETKTPVVVETMSQPQIDTTIVLHEGVADTSYIYVFPNIIVED